MSRLFIVSIITYERNTEDFYSLPWLVPSVAVSLEDIETCYPIDHLVYKL